ncbi:MAG TPA: imidazole glycerol phosphate synthase subunit HisF [Candidatus Wallbacteria bacterium]|nr:imidazole glycerol phosphate synthase subunit HisF [Candidatus Wallbacteria bacterium]
MLKVRVIPTILLKNECVVKGVGFDSWRRIGTILPAIKVYTARQVDELIIVDITATNDNRDPDYDEIENFSRECFVPLTIGGGIKNIGQVKKILRAGADKVCVNSAAYETPELITEIASSFGVQCVVASIDAKKVGGVYKCFSNCAKTETPYEAAEWAKKLEQLGAGEILITSIERDGTMSGYDHELIRCVSQNVKIPVIASGGAGCYEDMLRALSEGGASAVAAASMFHFTQNTPVEAKKYLSEKGVSVRNVNVRLR